MQAQYFHCLAVLVVFLAVAEARVHLSIPGVIPHELRLQPLKPYAQGCSIRITGDLGEPQPLILNPATNDILFPTLDSIGVLQLNTNQQIDLYCSTGFASPDTSASRVSAFCETGSEFVVDGRFANFSDVTCKAYPYHTARKTGQMCANGDGVEIEIGFDIGSKFLSFIDICQDEVQEKSFYSHIKMSALNYGYQSGFPRPSFLSTGFFNGKYVDTLYTNVNQVAVITQILGSEAQALKFIHPSATSDKYLARGHLTAKVEVIYGSQQRGTFWFMNVAPQYQAFNGGNWEALESSTRRFFRDRNIANGDLFTGTYGVMTLPDINNVQQEIFLYFDENNNGLIPAPALFYKIIVDNNTKKGIAIIGVNNIYLTAEEVADLIICNDVSDGIDWITWDRRNIERGYMYACTVEDLARVVGHLPNIDTSGGLLL